MTTANMMWGLMSPISKMVLITSIITPFIIVEIRIIGAAILFWIASIFTKREHVSPPDLLKLFFAAMLGVLFNQGLFTIGLGMTSPVDASIITTSTPILTMIIAAIYLKEPITSKKVSGIFLGASGALLLIVSNQNIGGTTHNSNIWGDTVCLVAELSSVQTTHQSLLSHHTHEMDVHLRGNMYHSILLSKHDTTGMVIT